MVIGSRYVKGGEVINRPVLRRVLSSGAALLSRLLIPHVKDSGSGFFAINRHILTVHPSPRGFRMGFEILGKPLDTGSGDPHCFQGQGVWTKQAEGKDYLRFPYPVLFNTRLQSHRKEE